MNANKEEIAAALAGLAMAIWMHFSPGWDTTAVSAIQGGLTVILVYIVGFLPKPPAA